MTTNKKLATLIIVIVVLVGVASFLGTQKNNTPAPTQTLMTPTTNQATTTDTSNWTLYTNKTYGYSIKFPGTYRVPPQSEKQKSQVGIDNNTCVKKNTAGNECVVIIDSFKNSDNLSLEDYLNKNLKMFGLFEATNPLSSPLVSYTFNGYDSLFNKNQFVFVKHGQYVYHISAPNVSSDKEVGEIVATFKFTQ